MRNNIKYIILILLVVFLPAKNSYAQEAGMLELHGIVESKSLPINKCLIKFFENGRLVQHSKTLSNGYFKVSTFLNSSYEVEFSKEGFEPYRIQLSTSVAGNGEQNLKSKILTIKLKPLSFNTDFNTSTYTEYSLSADGSFKIGKTVTKTPTPENTRELPAGKVADDAQREADEILALARIEAERILEDANRNKNEIDDRIRKLVTEADSISREATKNAFTNDVEAESENISEEKLSELKKKNEELQKLLNKESLVADDSLLIMENRLAAKEFLFEDLKDQLDNAENIADSAEMSRLRAIITKLEPELIAIRNETNKLENVAKLNKARLNEKNLQLAIIGGAVAFLLVVAFILLRMFTNKKKSNKDLANVNTALNSKNAEITEQKERIEAQKEKLDASHQAIRASINYASTIQNSMLPLKSDLQNLMNSFVLFRPKDIVSGDFYWSTVLAAHDELSEKKFIAAIDCTGHGVPGAFMSMIGNRLLNEIVNERKVISPAEILEQLNIGIKHSLKQETSSNRDGMDVCLCRLEVLPDGQTEITYCGAKRPLFHFNHKKRKIERFKGTRKSIGGSSRKPEAFKDQKFILEHGDELFLTSDGYIDQNNPKRDRFGTPKFTSLLQLIAGKPMNLQRNMLNDALNEFMDGEEQRDDILVIGLKY